MDRQMTKPWLSLALKHESLAMVCDPRQVSPIFIHKDNHWEAAMRREAWLMPITLSLANDMPNGETTGFQRLGRWNRGSASMRWKVERAP